MVKKKTLPSIRISEITAENISQSIKKYNQTNLLQLTLQDFRRLSYELLSQTILLNNQIPCKIIR